MRLLGCFAGVGWNCMLKLVASWLQGCNLPFMTTRRFRQSRRLNTSHTTLLLLAVMWAAATTRSSACRWDGLLVRPTHGAG